MQKKPWVHFRRVEWSDEAELRDLFSSEDLSTPHGHFFDQRYIDYLERNFPRIDDLKWRKFEGLTAEYFDRQGFAVELGPGRDDDGVDIRVWDTEKSSRPPLLIIQCKRTREKVGKVVVKALWADMQAEEAGGGLIVTTSSLSPGARRVCIARGYPVGEADRSALRLWLHALRTPGTGISTVT